MDFTLASGGPGLVEVWLGCILLSGVVGLPAFVGLLWFGPSRHERDIFRAARPNDRWELPVTAPAVFAAYRRPAPTSAAVPMVGQALALAHLLGVAFAITVVCVRLGVSAAPFGLSLAAAAFMVGWLGSVRWLTWVVVAGLFIVGMQGVLDALAGSLPSLYLASLPADTGRCGGH